MNFAKFIPAATDEEFQVTKAYIQTQIKKQPDVDEDNDVSLFCADYDKEIQHPSNTKGYVFHGDKLFFQGFPYSTELILRVGPDGPKIKSVENYPDFDLNKCRIFESHEGTIIRVFNIDNVWYTSTNRKLDALKSKWAAKHTTFGQSFADAIRDIVDETEEYSEELNGHKKFEEKVKERNTKDKEFLHQIYEKNLNPLNKYMFMLKPSSEERIVCRSEPTPTIYHVGTFDSENNLSLDEKVSLNGTNIETPKEIFKNNLHDLKISIDNININHHQGYILIQKGDKKEDKHYKIINDTYRHLFSVRGNVPSLRFRYLQLRKYSCGSIKNSEINEDMFKSFLDLYNYHNESANIEKEIYELCKNLHQKYLMLYVEKKKLAHTEGTDLSEIENDTLQNIIHKSYLETRAKTTISRINDLLTCNKPSIVNKLLNEKKLHNIRENIYNPNIYNPNIYNPNI